MWGGEGQPVEPEAPAEANEAPDAAEQNAAAAAQ